MREINFTNVSMPPVGDLPEVKPPAKASATPKEALAAAPTVYEVLTRPADYEKWFNGVRAEALNA